MTEKTYGGGEVTYGQYLKVRELTSLQRCLSTPPHHDELQFIIVHQTYELWFKLILHELDDACARLRQAGHDDVHQATRRFVRVAEIFKVLVHQIHVLETMTPLDFLFFREHLRPASGFQSAQFREVEFRLGVKDPGLVATCEPDAEAAARLERRLREPSLVEVIQDFLRARGFDLVHGDDDAAQESRARMLAQIYSAPDRHAEVFELLEAFMTVDEQVQLWRYHHYRMVDRMIGDKIGTGHGKTGGRSGARYLGSTLGKKVFPELWDARTYLEDLP
ncbi:MAG: tryptophan 2,3-dioxygenase family protein [Planctomycetota bacterium]